MAGRKQHDVVIKGAARRPLVAADHAAAVDEHKHRTPGAGGLRHEDIDDVARIAAVFHIAADLDARIGLLLLERRIELAGVLRIDHPAHRRDFLGEVGRHLCPRGGRRHQAGGGDAGADERSEAEMDSMGAAGTIAASSHGVSSPMMIERYRRTLAQVGAANSAPDRSASARP